MDLDTDLDHAAFRSALGTFLGYGIVLAVMTILLFGVPFAIFWLFG